MWRLFFFPHIYHCPMKEIIPHDFGLTPEELSYAFALDHDPMPCVPARIAARLIDAQVARRTEYGLVRGPRWNDL